MWKLRASKLLGVLEFESLPVYNVFLFARNSAAPHPAYQYVFLKVPPTFLQHPSTLGCLFGCSFPAPSLGLAQILGQLFGL